ncbi:MAG TPA: glycoside hydrolase family 68 protein [Candidatus Saccharimonas sp.]|nr:glycoside hydrolase family 68 protein [Candidatus Saccharimonas sp.]
MFSGSLDLTDRYVWDVVFPSGPGALATPQHAFYLQADRSVAPGERHFYSSLGHAKRTYDGWVSDSAAALSGRPSNFDQAIWGVGVLSLTLTNHLLFYTGLHYTGEYLWQQRIGLARSTNADLRDWQRLEAPILQPAPPYRMAEKDECGFGPIFRDPAPFIGDDGRLHVAFAARLADVPAPHNACIGHAVAINDELTDWAMLPPLVDGSDRYSEMEVPQVIRHGGLWYVFFTVHAMHYNLGWAEKVGDARPGLHCYVGPTLNDCRVPVNNHGNVWPSTVLRGPRLFGNPSGNRFKAQGWVDSMDIPGAGGLSAVIMLDLNGDNVIMIRA